MADKRAYKEKFEGDISPYEMAEEFPKMDEVTWRKGDNNKAAAAWLRHRFCLLFSTNGILRCEALYNANLSECRGLWVKKSTDVHKVYMLLMQIPDGKLNKFFFEELKTLRCEKN